MAHWRAMGLVLLEGISYAALKTALIAHDGSNPDALAAVNSLPSVDPSGGVGWSLPIAYARMLGLTTFASGPDDTVTLNTSYNWNYTQDVIGTLEHEITEGGMGRIGGLGKDFDNGGNPIWSTMDLFRYSSAGARDYTDGQDGKAAFFSVDGSQMLLQFNNQFNGATQVNGGDTADYNALDVFGVGSPGTGLFLSATDLKNMDVLGWTPAGDTTAPSLVADATMVAGIGLTQAIESSMLRFDDNASTHAQESYSVITGPAHGTLLKNGVATSSFTQADIDNGLITYHEIGNFSSDSFTFKVTDASNNATTTQQFNFQIVSPSVIESLGSTDLTQVGNNFYLDNSTGVGPSLKLSGADVVAGQFDNTAPWVPIGAEAIAGGYEVAWKVTGSDQYTVWKTDSSGNYTSNLVLVVSGTNPALESLETSFHQDLNGDGHIGLVGMVIESLGSTDLTQVGNNFYLDNSTGVGPSLKLSGADVVAGQFDNTAPWVPIGAEAIAGGYEVAWKVTGSDQYTVWKTDSSGNYTSNLVLVVSGTNPALESLETSFHQDLNGDGHIGLVGMVIESLGSTDLTQVGNNFYLDNSTGVGPSLKLSGADVVAGQFDNTAPWVPIGAEAIAGGYEVAWKVTGSDQYTVWKTDSSGNYTSNLVLVVSGTNPALESLETSFHQDLNGDGTIGVSGGNTSANAGAVISMAAAPVIAAPPAPGSSNSGGIFGSAHPVLSESLGGDDGHVIASVQSPSPTLSHDFHLV